VNNEEIFEKIKDDFKNLENIELEQKIELINNIKLELKKYSPFKNEPTDCVIWIKNNNVFANDYNPNSVAPPEMQLLHESILQDGYTQPIVSWYHDNIYEVVDGFHRNRVGREYKDVLDRVKGYLPLTIINSDCEDITHRMASTIRHNRARGKHKIDAMSDIVVELKKRNWSKEKIAKNLGMDEDEILRLCQISGLTEMFKDVEFSESWDIDIFDNNVEQEDVIDG